MLRGYFGSLSLEGHPSPELVRCSMWPLFRPLHHIKGSCSSIRLPHWPRALREWGPGLPHTCVRSTECLGWDSAEQSALVAEVCLLVTSHACPGCIFSEARGEEITFFTEPEWWLGENISSLIHFLNICWSFTLWPSVNKTKIHVPIELWQIDFGLTC